MPPDRLLASDLPTPLLCCLLCWLFAIGACIGSFMNVVIYRLPAGLSLLRPASRCPACSTPIRAADNVPIFGWLWLRGRCRRCRASISARYPFVELLVALLFVGLACAEPLANGANLPSAAEPPGGLSMDQLWGLYAYHLFLLCSLLCAAFTELDRHALSPRLVAPALIVGLAAPLMWPHLRPIETFSDDRWATALFDGLLGAAAGASLGFVGLMHRTDYFRRAAYATALAWVGAFLGWQAAAGLAIAAGATQLAAALASRFWPRVGDFGPIAGLAVWTAVWIAAWRSVAERLPWFDA